MATWLLKTEPGTYSFADLQRERKTTWDGVTNALARKHLRAMAKGDEVLVYHTGPTATGKRAVGIARVTRADGDAGLVEIAAVRALKEPVPLAAMRANQKLAGFDLLRLSRLSVVPVSAAHWKEIVRMAGG
jgi:predicted RNA-binding protein with PUA-like domain